MESGESAKKSFWYKLWCERHTRLESKKTREKYADEIAAAVSQDRLITSGQCPNVKLSTSKIVIKRRKIITGTKTGGDRKTSPFYDELDSVLGCRDIVNFDHVEEAGTSAGATGDNDDEGLQQGSEQEKTKETKRKKSKTSGHDEPASAAFCETMDKLQAQGDRVNWSDGGHAKDPGTTGSGYGAVYDDIFAAIDAPSPRQKDD
ncbi:hypothetical protein OS493_038889 [Desmophyllum pertusum]|uniref:Uncharacterized protein n=1 Tax=Desmophyllum pertusum TaxID=174260 RepID=A0A9W9Z6C3_9CNID|nr:hypothetical protein OS493_038889 [Desmophyllum pertusum]